MKPPMREDELLTAILDLCRLYRVRTAHFRPARTANGDWRTAVAGDGKGWPDLTLVGNRLIVRELKTDHGRHDPAQTAWLTALTAAGVDADTWRPAQWLDGTIRNQIRALRPGAGVA